MSAHALRPLMAPESIALVGASKRDGSYGLATLRNLANPHFAGRVHPVNPAHDEIDGLACHASLDALPERVDHAVLSVANAGLEAALVDAARHGARAVTIFASAYLEGDSGEPKLRERLQAIAREAGILVCGANCMGLVNNQAGVRATWIDLPEDRWFGAGHIALITHSGTCFLSLQYVDPRHRYNICVSSGQELTVTAADYIDYALEQDGTRVVALFLEAIRDADAFRAALDKAARLDIPVVALKVGRTDRSAALALSHSGALAGDDAVHDAVFDHYGVLRVESWDELAAVSLIFSHGKRLAAGGLAGIMDSGGARGMLLDLADRMGVPVADVGPATSARLASLLEYGLEPVNPTDVWGTGRDWENVFGGCMRALADDDAACMTTMFTDLGLADLRWDALLEIAERVALDTDKPVYVCQHWSRTMSRATARRAAQGRVLVFDGTESFLTAVNLAMGRRDRIDDGPGDMAAPPAAGVVRRWRARMAQPAPFGEDEGLALLADFGIAVPAHRLAASHDEVLDAAGAIGYPVALKTAEPGILHKSDAGGVRLGIGDAATLRAAWREMSQRLGRRVLVAAMAPRGVELAAGIVNDAQFGPLVMIGGGGVLIEVMKDRRFLLPPAGRASARRALDALACRPLLDGVRGAPACDIDAVCDAVARLAQIAGTLGERIAELDVNPLIAGPDGCVAVDALVVPRGGEAPDDGAGCSTPRP